MGNYDTASKHWVEHWPEAVLKVIMPGARFIGHQPTELPQVQRMTDRVMRVVEEADGRELLLHVEIQTQWSADVPRRIADYRTRFRFGRGEPVTSVVVILTQPPKGTKIVDRFVEGHGYDRIEVGFRVFELWRTCFSWEQLQDNPDLVPLAALSAETGAGDLWRLNEIVDSADMDYDRKVDLQTILVIMAGRGCVGSQKRSSGL